MKLDVVYKEVTRPIEKIVLEISPDEARFIWSAALSFRLEATTEAWTKACNRLIDALHDLRSTYFAPDACFKEKTK